MKTPTLTLLLTTALCAASPAPSSEAISQNYSKQSKNGTVDDSINKELNSGSFQSKNYPQTIRGSKNGTFLNKNYPQSDFSPKSGENKPKPPRNQYGNNEKRLRELKEAFSMPKKGQEETKNRINDEATDDKKTEMGRVMKRSYAYRGNVRRPLPVSIYEANTLWKPATYQIARPYYIPVYQFANHQHVYYPPQPFHNNPGVPKDNPLKPIYVGPSYLPPDETPVGRPTKPTGRPGTSTDMPLINKFDEDYDAPIWGEVPNNMVPLRVDDDEEENLVPTRPPAPPQGNFPPLLRPTTRPSNNVARPGNASGRPSFENRPSGARPPPTRPAPPVAPQTTPGPAPSNVVGGPNNCVWAIISCCSVENTSTVPEACFEQRGCAGPFWGASPCDSEFAKSAIEAAVQYYNGRAGP